MARSTKKELAGPRGSKRPPAGPARPTSVSAYLKAVPDDKRRALEKLRAQVRAAAPEATEVISYGIPTFKLKGTPLIYYGAWADHCSIYGVPMDLPELKKYPTSKGTIQFQADKPLPASLVSKLVKARIAEIEKGAPY